MNLSDLEEKYGTVGKIDGTEVAIYSRDNEIEVLENVCPHMGCQTAWNEAEQTWDCPCHGSRFAPTGKVIKGPATKPMKLLIHVIKDGELRLVE